MGLGKNSYLAHPRSNTGHPEKKTKFGSSNIFSLSSARHSGRVPSDLQTRRIKSPQFIAQKKSVKARIFKPVHLIRGDRGDFPSSATSESGSSRTPRAEGPDGPSRYGRGYDARVAELGKSPRSHSNFFGQL